MLNISFWFKLIFVFSIFSKNKLQLLGISILIIIKGVSTCIFQISIYFLIRLIPTQSTFLSKNSYIYNFNYKFFLIKLYHIIISLLVKTVFNSLVIYLALININLLGLGVYLD